MEYTVNKLAQMSGVSSRTLRFYDQIELLKPARVSSNGYRIYGKNEVDTLQQILFYRELGFPLDEIKVLLNDPDFNREEALENHLIALEQKKSRIEALIDNVTKTIGAMKGELFMNDKEKFEGFKQKLIDENENRYGDEIRTKYGDAVVNESNAKLKGMTEAQWNRVEQLNAEISETLKKAIEEGDPAGETAQRACDLHKQWLGIFWKDGMYSKETHKSVAEMYVADERFKAYYDSITEGCAEFLRDAINIYCE